MCNVILEIKNLSIDTKQSDQKKCLVKDVDFAIRNNSICALVGSSGSGKSLIASSIVGVLADNLSVEGEVLYDGKNLLTLSEKQLNAIRGKRIGIVMQNCAGSLNPLIRNGKQLSLVMRSQGISYKRLKMTAKNVLKSVRLDNTDRIMKGYPHELSGGMKQRLMMAIGMCGSPELIIMDEPTKGLDLILRNQIADMIGRMHREMGVSILLITHDLEMAHKLSDYCYVMNEGCVVTHGETDKLFAARKNQTLDSLLNDEYQMSSFFTNAKLTRNNNA